MGHDNDKSYWHCGETATYKVRSFHKGGRWVPQIHALLQTEFWAGSKPAVPNTFNREPHKKEGSVANDF